LSVAWSLFSSFVVLQKLYPQSQIYLYLFI
jgi:hypothetical protein